MEFSFGTAIKQKASNRGTPLRARTKKYCRAVHVIKGGVPHRLVAFWGRLNFQCFVRKFMNEYFEFYLVECAISLCIHGLDPASQPRSAIPPTILIVTSATRKKISIEPLPPREWQTFDSVNEYP